MINETDNNSDNRMVTGMFEDRHSAERAYNMLEDRGYGKDDINVIMSDETRKKYFNDQEMKTELGHKAKDGAGTGGAIGGALGGIIDAVPGNEATLLFPGAGMVITGPLATAITGAGAGGATGGLLGALIGSGIPNDHAEVFVQGIKDGQIVMGVKSRNDDDAQYLKKEYRAYAAIPNFAEPSLFIHS